MWYFLQAKMFKILLHAKVSSIQINKYSFYWLIAVPTKESPGVFIFFSCSEQQEIGKVLPKSYQLFDIS